jgi:hypothetical protein
MRATEHLVSKPAQALPLTLPNELWKALSPAQQAVYRRAEGLLDVFGDSRVMRLSQLVEQGPRAEVMRALQVLGSMSLVDIEPGEDGPTVTLRAVPDEHVRVSSPDGRPRWIFVARPLDPPTIDAADLN